MNNPLGLDAGRPKGYGATGFIVPVGLSLLTNFARDTKATPDVAQLDAFLDANPKKASAETNTLLSYGLEALDVVLLLTSDTDESRLCADAISAYLKRLNHCKAEAITIQGATFSSDDLGAGGGLRNVIDEFLQSHARLLAGNYPDVNRVCFVASGGYKFMTSLCTLAGLITRSPVLYINEKGTRPVEFPWLPITWSLPKGPEARQLAEKLLKGPMPLAEFDAAKLTPIDREMFSGLVELEPGGVTVRLNGIGYAWKQGIERAGG